MARINKNAPAPPLPTFDIVGLTHAEYQVIRNALYELADNKAYDSEFTTNDERSRSQSAIAADLHANVIIYQSARI